MRDSAERVCHLLALTVYQVRQHPSAPREVEVEHLRRRFIVLCVAVNVGRLSTQQAAPEFRALAQDIQRLQAQLGSAVPESTSN